MQKKLTLLRKAASLVLSISMIATLFGGMTVGAAQISNTSSFSEDFNSCEEGGPIGWEGPIRASTAAEGTVKAVKVDDRHGISAQLGPHGDNIYGASIEQNVSFTVNDLMCLSGEVYAPQMISQTLIDLWIGTSDAKGAAPAFGIEIANPEVKYLGAGTSDEKWKAFQAGSTTLSGGKWFKFDLIYNPANLNVKYYMDGKLIADYTATNIADPTNLGKIGISYRGKTDGICYFDNISFAKVDSSTVFYSDAEVAEGTADFSINFDETPTGTSLNALNSIISGENQSVSIGEKIIAEKIDVTQDKMLLGASTPVEITYGNIVGGKAEISGFDISLSDKLPVPGEALRITVKDIETITGKTVDIVRVYYPQAPPVPNEGELAIPVETFDSFDPATATTLPEGWTGDTTRLRFAVNTEVTGTKGMKMYWTGGRTLKYIEKSVDIDLTNVEKLEYSFKMKIDDISVGASNYKIYAPLNDGTTDVVGFNEIQNGGSSNGLEIRAIRNSTTDTQNNWFGDGNILDEPEYNFQYDKWNDMKLEWTVGNPDVKYFINGQLLGTRKHKDLTGNAIKKIRLGLCAGNEGTAVSFDDITIRKYMDPNAYPTIKNILFLDGNGSVMATEPGKAPAGAKKLLINLDNSAGITSDVNNTVTLSGANVNAGTFADGAYTIDLNKVLLSGEAYTLTVPAAILGEEYQATFTCGTAAAKFGDIEFVNNADSQKITVWPADSTSVLARVMVTNPTYLQVDGKLIIQVFEKASESAPELVKYVYINDISGTVDDGFCDYISVAPVTVNANTTRLRALLWDGYDTINILSPKLELVKTSAE